MNLEAPSPFVYEPQSLAGKRIVVTGGTTGIGRAAATLLAAHGARVLLFGRHEAELQDTLRALRDAGGEAHGLTADTARAEDVRRVFEEADRTLGGLDVLVNNAALGSASVLEGEREDWQYQIDTNVAGYFACAREALLRMKRQGHGHLVNIGSMSADLREEGNDVYVATKAAIQAFSESLRKTVNEHGIKVTVIEPGKVATDIFEMSDEEKEEHVRKLEMLRPEDVAACIYYCLAQPQRCDIVSVQLRPHRQMI